MMNSYNLSNVWRRTWTASRMMLTMPSYTLQWMTWLNASDLAKPEYSTVDQFQELSDMLSENAVCKLVTQHECTNPNDFRRKLKDAIVKDVPTIIQINAMTHTDDGILTKGTW